MNAIAHYLPTAAQPVPEQQPIASFSLNLYTEHNIIWYGTLASFGSAVLSQLPVPTAYSLVGGLRS